LTWFHKIRFMFYVYGKFGYTYKARIMNSPKVTVVLTAKKATKRM